MTATITDTMTLRRLGWAGVEIRLGTARVLIDPLETVAPLAPVLGEPKRPLPPVELDENTHVLVTHLHPDHYDRALLTTLPGPRTLGCHTVVADEVRADGLDPISQNIGEVRQIGKLAVTPVVSLDWRGTDSDQVAWIIEGGGTRVIHCGDTMWHGNWWQIAREYGAVDIAFVPVNGVIAKFEGYEADVPVTLTPEQAVEAAAVLGASAVCAIHYELFNNPPLYTQQDNIAARVTAAARAKGITPILVGDGESVPTPPRRPA